MSVSISPVDPAASGTDEEDVDEEEDRRPPIMLINSPNYRCINRPWDTTKGALMLQERRQGWGMIKGMEIETHSYDSGGMVSYLSSNNTAAAAASTVLPFRMLGRSTAFRPHAQLCAGL